MPNHAVQKLSLPLSINEISSRRDGLHAPGAVCREPDLGREEAAKEEEQGWRKPVGKAGTVRSGFQ